MTQYRIEVYPVIKDTRGMVVRKQLADRGFSVSEVILTNNYSIIASLDIGAINEALKMLVNPVTQSHTLNEAYLPEDFTCAIEIGYLPGVTDNVAHTVRDSLIDLFGEEHEASIQVYSSNSYFIKGNITEDDAIGIARELHNPLIQRSRILFREEYIEQKGMGISIPCVHLDDKVTSDTVDLDIDDDELIKLGKEGIKNPDGTRRGPLALDMPYMKTIQSYFRDREGRNPKDIELESIAQTWSEHCKHTIFAAEIDEIKNGIFRDRIRSATVRIRNEKGEKDFCVSVFSDNAGGIVFDDEYIIADKVETHNSPCALDPFGGAITGIVGVNRDAIGFGMASKPVANRYGFCFADPFDEKPLYIDPKGERAMLAPRRIMEGVIHGVNAGGNTSGIPTPQGFLYFNERYKGKPLVFVGTVGLIPRKVCGALSVEKRAMPGDRIVMVGGRVGRDGIHGATFSSEALDSGSPATAVQIGDPITQKKLSDAIVKEARDQQLYHSITDNGAGGLSCSVAEMARESGGFVVDLEKVPLKYHGLSPWQIWISESQERMTLAVPPDKLDQFFKLMKRRGVEAADIGEFTAGERGIVRYRGEEIFNLDMNFLHDGLPHKKLQTKETAYDFTFRDFETPSDLSKVILDMASRQNCAGYSFVSTQFDHEVQGNSVLKPLHGPGRVNASATVIRPVLDSKRGAVLSQGMYPSYSEINPYRMAACSIDTSVRNAVAVGGDMDYMAILDNFCWCDSNNPERLWQLKEASRACYDTAVAYGTPFISGKDSMFNDFNGYDHEMKKVKISVPPTLLISSLGVITDIDICQTSDFKSAGDSIYILGISSDEMGGSEYLAYMGEAISGKPYVGTEVPDVDTETNIRLYRQYRKALGKGIIASGIGMERGGLGIALVRSALGGMLGCDIDLGAVPCSSQMRDDYLLFNESQGRFLVTVSKENEELFMELFSEQVYARLGHVNESGVIGIKDKKSNSHIIKIEDLYRSYHDVFANF